MSSAAAVHYSRAMTDADASRAALVAALAPILAALVDADGTPRSLATADDAASCEAMLTSRWPLGSAAVVEIAELLGRGIAEGWLCERGEPHARFGRLAKPTPATHGHSIDIVCLTGAALAHRHPAGEITLALPRGEGDGAARFDGRRAGWIVLPADTQHVPTVTDGTMVLLYALPGGQVVWS